MISSTPCGDTVVNFRHSNLYLVTSHLVETGDAEQE